MIRIRRFFMCLRWWLMLPLLTTVSACSVGVDIQRAAPEKKTFVMEVTRPAAATPEHAPTVSLGLIRVAPEYERRALVYRIDGQRYEADFYNQWLSSPRDQIAHAAGEWFRRGAVFRDVLPPALAGRADYRLDLFVPHLYVDMRDPAGPLALVEIQAHLSVRSAEGRDVVLNTRVRGEEPVASASPEDRVFALSRSVGHALASLERELAMAVDRSRSGL